MQELQYIIPSNLDRLVDHEIGNVVYISYLAIYPRWKGDHEIGVNF